MHHLDGTANGKDFPIIEQLFGDTKRILRCNGIMIVLTCTPFVKNVIWYASLYKDLFDRHLKRMPSVMQFTSMLSKCKLELRTKLNVLGAELLPNNYDAEGPLKESWRKGNSLFANASDKEIQEAEDLVRKMKGNGTLEDFMLKHDKALDIGGLPTILLAISA